MKGNYPPWRPALPPGEFRRRRERFMRAVGPGGIAIVGGGEKIRRNGDVDYPFRPDSDFYYLSGCAEPGAFAVLAPGREEGEFVLFLHKRDKNKELWEGPTVGVEAACEVYGADQAFALDQADTRLPAMLSARQRLYYSTGRRELFDAHVKAWAGKAKRGWFGKRPKLAHAGDVLAELRARKSEGELALMRRAGEIGARAHGAAMRACRAGMYEYELEAVLLREFVAAGARELAYPCIVGSGPNACILHYTDNSRQAQDGELVLIDAGCEWDYYACDITRTFPVNGRFSPEQRRVHDIVARAQEAAIENMAPGRSWEEIHRTAARSLIEGMVELGWLSGEVDAVERAGQWKQFFPHRTGHWLGMDVHDAGKYFEGGEKRSRKLEEGMVMTVEPGLYVPLDCEAVEPRWRGIGVRIEDDVLVTASGGEVINGPVARTADEIEAWMGEGD